MKVQLCLISPRRGGLTGPAGELVQGYIGRSSRYVPCSQQIFSSEDRFLQSVEAATARTRPAVWLADSRGQQISSEDLAAALGTLQDTGVQQLIFAVGGADGWSGAALARADRTVAFGRITLPHELAAVVVAEQVYRALSIRAGHPYHSGH
jgi:23S rRNA (pseudouridine1915-N3)-methyltransferase